MSSSQWEVVTKSKKAKNLDKKVEAHTEKKRQAALLPKLEEILPSHEYRTLLSGKRGKENHSPAKSVSSSTKSKSSPIKKNANNSKDKTAKKEQSSQQQAKSKSTVSKPKSLESAMRSIEANDFATKLEQLKIVYPGSELLWLKGVASFFNEQLPFDCDPIFSGKSIYYPSNLASTALYNAIVDFLESVGEENLSYFYHTLLINMTMDLSKNMPIVGYKFILQLISQHWPHVASNNMAKIALLRNSYQNRSNICLSILWAIGQGGYKEITEGIKVWQNLMLPNLELKSYTKFVAEYLEKVLSAAKEDCTITLNQNEFFSFYNALKTHYPIPKENQETLGKCAHGFLIKYILSSSKHSNIFVTLFRNIDDFKRSRSELEGCLCCLVNGEDSFKVWKMNYKKQLTSSLLLFKEIEKQLDKADIDMLKLACSNTFQAFLDEAQRLNEELSLAKRKDPNLEDLIAVVKNVQEKTTQQKKKQIASEQKKCGGCCKWVLGSFVLIALIAGVLVYDTNVNGKGVFERSATGKILKNAGVLPHVEKAWYTTMGAAARGYKWAEKHVPPYAKPAGQLACDLFKLARNAACNVYGVVTEFVAAKLPVAASFLEQYVPGLPKKIENTSLAIKNVCVDVFGKAVVFFRTQVFIGRLSPENLSKALNQTQNAALDYYNQFHKKVDTYSKLK
ncbi:transmembrane protein 214 [Bactrocera neohumeralis]|uniref:transmembrane protein 214 n=1 Tax=Bactrocera neohumeralis TaxID=98809 RepID=UPI0021659B06|nr:transmembrane protein 214 [Bactrocera neohumeralis]